MFARVLFSTKSKEAHASNSSKASKWRQGLCVSIKLSEENDVLTIESLTFDYMYSFSQEDLKKKREEIAYYWDKVSDS